VLVIFVGFTGAVPLIVETMICGVQITPLVVRMPVFTWSVERDVAITSPISKKALLKPSWRESTTRELMYPCVAVT
jgi:hypothetical protein